MAESDELGFFYPKDVKPPLERIRKKECSFDTFKTHIAKFCGDTKGAVLRKDERTSRPRYRFSNPLLQPYVLIRGLADGMITAEDLKATRDLDDPQGRLF